MIVAQTLAGRIPLSQLELIVSSTRDSHGTLRVRISSLSGSVASLCLKSSLMGP